MQKADLGVVERVLRETGVDQTVPSPGWAAYAQGVVERLGEKLFGAFPNLRDVATLLGPVAVVIAVVLVLTIVAVLLRIAVEAGQRRRLSLGAATHAVRSSPPPGPERDRAGWREEIDRCLARGDLTGALEALWWWFARTISASPVDRAWTSGELLVHCQRPDLAPVATRLDSLLYGARRPRADDVRSFLRRSEEALS